ncbi:hypothetical protein GCM10027277_13780 [Pseudoduganella ginsengisoli]|uniref:hypothetical protein n=1 Tax=Pseudoduganella ginsengisoli TaxID=1462440 RepID=UPI001BACC031|nr:hypothetical protein [Pseudoduganella ginsengisoli]
MEYKRVSPEVIARVLDNPASRRKQSTEQLVSEAITPSAPLPQAAERPDDFPVAQFSDEAAMPPSAAALGVSFDGRTYHYRQYSYEQLADALDYARRDRAKPGFREDATPYYWRQWASPTPEERLQMARHGIAYEQGHYCYGPYRYDTLSAAVNYAAHAPGLGRPGADNGGKAHDESFD